MMKVMNILKILKNDKIKYLKNIYNDIFKGAFLYRVPFPYGPFSLGPF